jgi:hypothetical protein
MSPLILDGGQAAEMADGGEEEREEEEIEVEEGGILVISHEGVVSVCRMQRNNKI